MSAVFAPHLGLVKDKMGVFVKVGLYHQASRTLAASEAGFCHVVFCLNKWRRVSG